MHSCKDYGSSMFGVDRAVAMFSLCLCASVVLLEDASDNYTWLLRNLTTEKQRRRANKGSNGIES
jgi:hypothetical protein